MVYLTEQAEYQPLLRKGCQKVGDKSMTGRENPREQWFSQGQARWPRGSEAQAEPDSARPKR